MSASQFDTLNQISGADWKDTQEFTDLLENNDAAHSNLYWCSQSDLYLACIGSKGIASSSTVIRTGHRQCDVYEVMQTDEDIDVIIRETESSRSGLNCRTNAASTFNEGLLYVFGGTSLTEDGKVRVHNDLWMLNVVKKEWKCLHPGLDEYNGGELSVAFSHKKLRESHRNLSPCGNTRID